MPTTSVRFQTETMDKLRAYRDNLQVAFNRDPKRFHDWPESFRLSLDDALKYLLFQQQSHGKRAKKGFDAGGRDKDKALAYEGKPGPSCGGTEEDNDVSGE